MVTLSPGSTDIMVMDGSAPPDGAPGASPSAGGWSPPEDELHAVKIPPTKKRVSKSKIFFFNIPFSPY
jgi:hypothetical protein